MSFIEMNYEFKKCAAPLKWIFFLSFSLGRSGLKEKFYFYFLCPLSINSRDSFLVLKTRLSLLCCASGRFIKHAYSKISDF